MIALITGVNGFVGPYLRDELEKNNYEVFGLGKDILDDKTNGHDNGSNAAHDFSCDITNYDEVYSLMDKIRPDCVFHLAGFSSVAKSFENPGLCHKINVEGTKNLLDSIVQLGLKTKVLVVSSAEVYGIPKYLPIDEAHPLNPGSPYAQSRVDVEHLIKKYVADYKLHIVISRSFNHTGPTQQDTFVIPAFSNQIKKAVDGDTIYVGNLDIVKDFSDVRDVVKAYRLLIERGLSGEIYNVGSGNMYKLRDILDDMILSSGKKLRVEVSSEKYRKADIPIMCCNPKKLFDLTGLKFKKVDFINWEY